MRGSERLLRGPTCLENPFSLVLEMSWQRRASALAVEVPGTIFTRFKAALRPWALNPNSIFEARRRTSISQSGLLEQTAYTARVPLSETTNSNHCGRDETTGRCS